MVVFGLVILVLMVITAIFAPLLAPYNPNKIHPVDSLSNPSKTYLLGTDKLGRDTLSRLIYGTRQPWSWAFLRCLFLQFAASSWD